MSFKTCTAHLLDGDKISYLDSGPVEGSSTYSTVVMIHGYGFNAHIFDPLFALAARYNLRLIALQRKGYSGSTDFTDAEIEELLNGNKIFLDRLAVLLGSFICHLIRVHKIPEPNDQQSEGGIALLGWSIGCTLATAFLSDCTLFKQEEYEILRHYIVKLVLYDAPYLAFGFDPMPGIPPPHQMFGTTGAEFFDNFMRFSASYYDHPKDWDGDPNQLDLRPRTDRVSIDSWPQGQMEKVFQPSAAFRCDFPMASGKACVALYGLTQRAFFDEDHVKTTFPELSILYVICWRSARNCLWSYHNMKLAYQQRLDRNQFVRPLTFKVIKEGNHFWHCDSPEEFLQVIADGVRGI